MILILKLMPQRLKLKQNVALADCSTQRQFSTD